MSAARTVAAWRLRCAAPKDAWGRFWRWTLQERVSWKQSPTEVHQMNAAVICTVFAITGSSSVALVRPCLKHATGIEGTLKDGAGGFIRCTPQGDALGPWSYRIASVVVVSPIYSIMLVSIGTVFGRHRSVARA